MSRSTNVEIKQIQAKRFNTRKCLVVVSSCLVAGLLTYIYHQLTKQYPFCPSAFLVLKIGTGTFVVIRGAIYKMRKSRKG